MKIEPNLSESSSLQFPPSGDGGDSQTVNATDCDDGGEGSPTWNIVTRRGLRNKTSIKQQQKVNTKRILGEGAVDVNIGLQSAVPIIRKAVFHINNLSPASTVTTVQDHLQRHNIQVLSCHGAKSWMPDDEKDQVVAFRVCIPAELTDRPMDTRLVISYWRRGRFVVLYTT